MLRLYFILSILPFFAPGQEISSLPKEQQIKTYCRVIAEYINSLNKNPKLNFDTLYIGNHPEFPQIKLPDLIEGKKIILLTYKEGDKEPQNNNSFVFVNIIELKSSKNSIEFMLVTFHKGYHPQHNSYIHLKYNPKKKEYVLGKEVRFEDKYHE